MYNVSWGFVNSSFRKIIDRILKRSILDSRETMNMGKNVYKSDKDDASGLYILSEKEFYNFVLTEYEPSIYESAELKDPRFYPGTYYPYICKTRCYYVYREIATRLGGKGKVIDLGFFPGTLLRELKILLKDRIKCYGVGLNVTNAFKKFMSPYVEESVNVELDPFYMCPKEEGKIPFENDFFDAVIATEIIEHLISPLEMIAEGARILRKGGLFIITTPNVSHIGAVLKLMIGRSNYERLDRSPMYLQNDPWRGHIRFYDKIELKILFERHGLKMIYHKYYRERGWEHAKLSLKKKIAVSIVDKLAPIYRENHFAVFEKI